MTRIGMQDLRRNTGEYVRRVGKGETIEITRRGRPVAQLRPPARPTNDPDRSSADGEALRVVLQEQDQHAF